MRKKIQITVCVLLLLALGSFIFYQQSHDRTIQQSGFYFNTIINITLYHGEEDLLKGCFELADTYENYFSTTVPDSDIAKINAAGGTPVTVHEETIALLKKGIAYGKLSEGRFDITVGALSSLWDFTNNTGTVPDASAIEKATASIDYQNVVINGNTVTLKDQNAQIDLGGIAKGYIADQMKQYLTENGVTSGIINLGGNVLTIGTKDDGSSYHVGIQRPFDDSGTPIASVDIKDQTVVSSGVYERYFYVGEKLYHHLLDTSTGYPVDNDLYGVTIICDRSVDGDALSTTCFSLGLEKGMEFVEQQDGVEAVFITDDYALHTSSGIGSTIPYSVEE